MAERTEEIPSTIASEPHPQTGRNGSTSKVRAENPAKILPPKRPRLRVLQVNYRHTFGGSERLAATIGTSLDPERFDSLFAAMKGDGEVGEMLRLHGYPTVMFGRSEGFDPLAIWRVFDYFRRTPIDIVQTHHMGSLVYCGMAAKLMGMKIVHTEHDVHSFRRLPNEMRWLKRLAWLPDRFVVIDPSIGDFLADEIGIARNRIRVIRNGIDLDKFSAPTPRPADPHAPFVIGWVARLAPPKRPDVLIDALALLAPHDPNLRVRVIGGGEQFDGLSEQVRRRGLTERVELLGPRDDISEQLQGMDAYVLTTEREGLPISLAEAMATERPCIVSAVGGIPSLVKHEENGLLLDDLRPELLADMIRRLRSDQAECRRLGAAGRHSVAERFDLRETIKEYESVFEEVAGDPAYKPRRSTLNGAVKQAAYSTLCSVQADRLARSQRNDCLTIVCYHALAPETWSGRPSWLLLPVQSFREQVDYLKRHYRIIRLSEAVQKMAEGHRFDEPTACITFDDGYLNNKTIAFPILRELDAPATIYLATGLIGTQQVHWTARLERAMMTAEAHRLNLLDVGLSEYPLGEHYGDSFTRLVARLYRFRDEERERIFAVAIRRLRGETDGDFSCFDMMTWDDIHELDQSGLIEFGGHTVNHQIVEPLDNKELRSEVGGSIEVIRQHVKNRSLTFAYPNGTPRDFDFRVRQVLTEHGVIAAVSTIEGINRSTTDLFALRRISIGSNMNFSEFRLHVSGIIPSLKTALNEG